jgi:hypothetical protein
MRILALAVLAIGATAAMAPASAQTYDPNFPVCMRVVGPLIYFDCSYTSIAQCSLSAQGRAGQCLVNPYFAGAYRAPPGPPRHRRHHRAH